MSIINNRKNSAVGVKETYVALLTGALLLDVREIEEFEAGHVQGAINIPLSELNERYIELDKNDEIHIICKSGGRSAQATEFLASAGYNVRNVSGGSLDWYSEELPFISENGEEPTVL